MNTKIWNEVLNENKYTKITGEDFKRNVIKYGKQFSAGTIVTLKDANNKTETYTLGKLQSEKKDIRIFNAIAKRTTPKFYD
mgnify:CR=1 FL=1